jgi:hypothetical protein
MKKLVFTILLSIAIGAHAHSSKFMERAPQNYLRALNSPYPHMVEDAIFYSVKLSYFYPEIDVKGLTEKIDKLSRDGKTQMIRYTAYLASYLLNNPEMFSGLKHKDFQDRITFFQNLADWMYQDLLAKNQ